MVAMTDDDTLSRGVVSGGTGRVFLTDRNRSGYRGNRSNRSGPVPVPGGYKSA